MKSIYITTAVLIGIFSTTVAFAQITPNVWSRRVYQREMLKIAGNGAVNRALINKRRGANNTAAPAPKAKKILTATGPTAFKFSAQYIMPAMALKEFEGSPQEKTAVADEIKGFIDSYKNTARQDGFAANDLAFGLLHNFIAGYFAYTNIDCGGKDVFNFKNSPTCRYTDKLTHTNFKTDSAIVEQFRAVLTANQGTAKMSDYDKQLMAESLAVKTALFNKKYTDAVNGGGTTLLEVKQEAGKIIEDLLGSSADKVSVSEEGIQIK